MSWNKEVTRRSLEWKIFIQFCSGVLEEESTVDAFNLIDQVLKNTRKSIKLISKVKVENNGSHMLQALDILEEQNILLINSPVLSKLQNYFKKSIINYLFQKTEKFWQQSKESHPVIYMTHYLNTVDEHYEYLTKERLQIMSKNEVKSLRSKYWAVLKENK